MSNPADFVQLQGTTGCFIPQQKKAECLSSVHERLNARPQSKKKIWINYKINLKRVSWLSHYPVLSPARVLCILNP